MRVVFDTSVLVSALQYGGSPRLALSMIAAEADHQIVLSDTIRSEMQRVLRDRFAWTSDDLDEAFSLYFVNAIPVKVQGIVHSVCRDAKDDMVLESALLSHSERLVTGDKDLLVLEHFHETRILSVRAFLDELHNAH